MIEQQARVVQVSDGIAEIVTRRQTACGACDARSGCGTSLIAAWFPERHLTLHLRNSVNARAGDEVIVGLDEAMLQRGSLLLYALPLAGLLLGAVVGERLFGALGLSAELGAVASGLMGLIAALAYVRVSTSGPRGRGDSGVRLLRVVHRKPSIAVGDLQPPPVGHAQGFRKQ